MPQLATSDYFIGRVACVFEWSRHFAAKARVYHAHTVGQPKWRVGNTRSWKDLLSYVCATYPGRGLETKPYKGDLVGGEYLVLCKEYVQT